MAKKSKNLTHTYRIPHLANTGKVQELAVLYAVYSGEFKALMTQRFKQYIREIPHSLSYFGSTKEVTTPLSQSQYQGCLARVCDALKSHVALLHDKALSLMNKSSLRSSNQALYDQVRYLCRSPHIKDDFTGEFYTAGYNTITDDYGQVRVAPNRSGWQFRISPEAVRLAHTLFAQARTRISFPDMQNPRMVLDSRTVTLAESEANHKGITHWAEISLLPMPETEKAKPKKERSIPVGYSNGKKLAIPLFMHAYAEDAPGTVSNSLELLMRGKNLQIALWKKATPEEYKAWHYEEQENTSSAREVAFDLGLCTLLASSEGHCYGQFWKDSLACYDLKLQSLMRQRQKLGLPVASKRYNELVAKIRGFISTEVNRIINQFVRRHPCLETVVLEDLYFKDASLSKQLNRMIRNFGQARILSKFEELAKLYQFKVVKLQAAWSSQECTHCGWVDSGNRTTQAVFQCKLCGSTGHADNHASNTLLKRFYQGMTAKTTRQAILANLRERFLTGLNVRIRNGIISLTRLVELLSQEKLAVLVKDKAFWARLTVLLQGFHRTRGYTAPFPTRKPAREVKSVTGAVQYEIAPSTS